MFAEDMRSWLFLLDHTFKLLPLNQLIVAEQRQLFLRFKSIPNLNLLVFFIVREILVKLWVYLRIRQPSAVWQCLCASDNKDFARVISAKPWGSPFEVGTNGYHILVKMLYDEFPEGI